MVLRFFRGSRFAAFATVIGLASLAISNAGATTLGWGNRPVSNNDSDSDLMVVATGASAVTLVAGNYAASTFDFQFTQAQATIGGTITPLVLVSPSANVFTVVAIGSPITYSGTTSFASGTCQRH